MLSIIEKIFDKFNIKFTYNKVDNSVHTTNIDKSTKIIYSDDIPLSSEAVKLIDDKIEKKMEEKLEKIKELTKANFENACKEKPEQMNKFIEACNLSKLSAAGSTVTASHQMSWLTGVSTVEPLEPMPSGDFIKQLPNAIDKITVAGATVAISDVVIVGGIDEDKDPSLIKEIKMNQEQTYSNCSYFDIRNLCPHRDEELMKAFIDDISTEKVIDGHIKQLDFSKAEEVNKLLCNTCTSFKDKRS
jgi:hypothetical protein